MQPIINQHWNCKRGRKRSASSLDVRTRQLFFDLHPIKVNVTPVRAGRFTYTGHHRIAPVITVDFFSAAKRIDVYDYIHSSKLIRLYFSPTQFRAPLNLDKAWKCDSFRRLLWFIEHSSKNGDSPVVYHGKEKGRGARFVCTHRHNGERCPSFFAVKVDQFGFFIHLYNHDQDSFAGWRWHEHFHKHL